MHFWAVLLLMTVTPAKAAGLGTFWSNGHVVWPTKNGGLASAKWRRSLGGNSFPPSLTRRHLSLHVGCVGVWLHKCHWEWSKDPFILLALAGSFTGVGCPMPFLCVFCCHEGGNFMVLQIQESTVVC